MDQKEKSYSERLLLVALVFFIIFVIITGRLYSIQIHKHEENQKIITSKLTLTNISKTSRGKIFTRDGKLLAQDKPSFQLSLNLDELNLNMGIVQEIEYTLYPKQRKFRQIYRGGTKPTPKKELMEKINNILPRLKNEPVLIDLASTGNLDLEELCKEVRKCLVHCLKKWQRPNSNQPLDIYLDSKTAFQILHEKYRFYGFSCFQSTIRYYPEKEFASHLVGYIGNLKENEYKILRMKGRFSASGISNQSIVLNDVEKKTLSRVRNFHVGVEGSEMVFNEHLRGKLGRMRQLIGLNQQKHVIEKSFPKKSGNISLTLDYELQKEAEKQLGDRLGAIVMIELNTGDVIVAASSPTYDPNLLSPPTNVSFNDVIGAKKGLLINRTLRATYPFGSVFKIITATAALEEGIIQPGSTFVCHKKHPKTKLRCLGYHNDINVTRALKKSCNIFFYDAGLALNVNRLHQWADLFYLGKPLKTGFPFEKGGINPSPLYKRNIRHGTWYPGDTCNFSIGQGYQQGTPLQVATLVGLISRPEGLKSPRLWKHINNQPIKLNIKPSTRKTVNHGLWQVVNEQGGTAYNHRSEKIAYAGKTGTADIVKLPSTHPKYKAPHAWFAGFAPFNDPQIAMAIIVENGGHGGDTSAPIAKVLVELWAKKFLGTENTESVTEMEHGVKP